jgi:hypothetical protein
MRRLLRYPWVIQAETPTFGVLKFFQVVLCPIEKTMTQWDLLVPVLSTALPEPSIIADALFQSCWFYDPENECRLIATVCHLPLEAHNRGVNVFLQPIRHVLWRKSVDAGLKTCDHQGYLIHEGQLVFRPTSFTETQELPQTDDLISRAQLAEFLGVPEEGNPTSSPQIIV